jgi:transcriptional regulator with XRE-family HTH domain
MMQQTNTIVLVTIAMKDQHIFLNELGSRIQEYRKELGLTQTEFGKMLNLSQQVIADYEAGHRNIPIYTLANIAEALGVDISDLVNGKKYTRKRGPAPTLQKQLEVIQRLPKERRNAVMQVIEMAVKT